MKRRWKLLFRVEDFEKRKEHEIYCLGSGEGKTTWVLVIL